MPLSFPASPTVGQQSTQNGRTYSWTGYAWELVAAAGGGGLSWSSVPASATASGTAGEIAYDHANGFFYVATATNSWKRTALTTWYDSDAAAFLSAASITNETQSAAVSTMVVALKSAGVWSKLHAIYPFVGGSESSHKWNLKDPRDLNAAYRLSFAGSWTHASTGVTPSSTYADTFFNPATAYTAGTYSCGIYIRNNPSSSNNYRIDMGCADQVGGQENGRFYAHLNSGDGNSYFDFNSRATVSNSTYGSAAAFHAISRDSSTSLKVYNNGSQKAENTNSQAWPIPSRTVWIGANNNSEGGQENYSNREVALAFLGSAMTGSEMSAFYTAVQAFQTALSRNV